MRNAYSTTVAVALGAAALTLLVSVVPWIDLAYRSPSGHVALETAAGLIALLVAYLVFNRFARDGQLADLILVGALILLGVTNLAFSVLPSSAGSALDRFAIWAPVGGRLLGAFGFALAAVVGPRRIRRPRAALGPFLLTVFGLLGGLALVFALAANELPLGIDPSMSPETPNRPRIVGSPGLLAIQLVSAGFYAVAAIGFARRGGRTQGELFGWLGIAAVLAAFANLNYFLFPSLYSEWVYTGDFFRLGTYAVLFVGAVREIARYQRDLAGTAVLEERRRLARELHDGLAQELAFISTQTRLLEGSASDHERIDRLGHAAGRALDESRSAIAALTRPLDEPLGVAVAQAAEEVADRCGLKMRLDLAPGLEAEPRAREALIRIVREAINNTARHGKASTVTVALDNDGGTRLRIEDDGVGFDLDERAGGAGFGLTSMRERAEALGGGFNIASTPGKGTEIEVVIP